MKKIIILLIFLFAQISFAAHDADIFPDQDAIIRHEEFADNLEKDLQLKYPNVNISVNSFGEEAENLLIISPICKKIYKEYKIVGAKDIGIRSCICHWIRMEYHMTVN